MNKFITLIVLAYLLTLVTASWTSYEITRARSCVDQYHIINCEGDISCNQQIFEIRFCLNNCNNKPESIGYLTLCTRNCSANYQNEKVQKHYSGYVDCLGQNILTFATLLITIFFMLF